MHISYLVTLLRSVQINVFVYCDKFGTYQGKPIHSFTYHVGLGLRVNWTNQDGAS